MGSMMGAMSIWHVLLFTYFRGDLSHLHLEDSSWRGLERMAWNGWLSEHH
jgi:hypothetical protein